MSITIPSCQNWFIRQVSFDNVAVLLDQYAGLCPVLAAWIRLRNKYLHILYVSLEKRIKLNVIFLNKNENKIKNFYIF